MPPIRRTLQSALWGMAGPVFVAITLSSAFGPFRHENASLEGFVFTIVNNLQSCFFWIALEAGLGFGFGVMRGVVSPDKWRPGYLFGALIWAVTGAPFLLGGIMIALLAGALPHGGPTFIEAFLPILGMYAGHVAGGAIAGFQVEYFLVRSH